MTQYFLPMHVHMCATEHMAIFLDLKKDEYIGLDRRQVLALRSLLRGWPSASPADAAPADEAALAFAETLVARGLLTVNSDNGKEAAPIAIETADSELVESYTLDSGTHVRGKHIVAFVSAIASARLALRHRSLEQLVAKLRAKKQRASGDLVSPDELRPLVIAFHRIRRFFYTSHDNCLFDSVAMMMFLGAHGAFPTWVIGVQPSPFLAHAWLQAGRYTLNCSPQTAQRYIPILTV